MLKLLPFLFLAFSFSAIAQNSLSGKVVDADNQETLPGTTIYISDLKKGTTTAVDGTFKIDHLPAGKFLVEVRYIGYAPYVEYLKIEDNTEKVFQLSINATELNNVVITGTGAATEASKNPVATTFIDKDELTESSASNIIDAISKKPGVSQISTGPAIGKPIIRGLGSNRIVTLNNNIKQEGQQWGDEHGIEIDEYSVDKVEIIKGPGSLMYGSDAMAGVINFLPPNPVNNGRVIGSLSSNYQSNNNLQGYSLMNAGNLNDFNWRVRLSHKIAGNYENDIDGKVYNSGFKEWDVNGYIGINKKWGYSHLNFSRFDQKLAIAEGERNEMGQFLKLVNNAGVIEESPVNSTDLNNYQIDFPQQAVTHYIISSANNFIIGDSRLAVNVGFQQNIRKEFANPVMPDETELHMELNTWSYDLKYHIHEFEEWETNIGLSGQIQHNTNFGEEYLIPEYNLVDGGVFIVTQREINNLNISAGLRYDIRKLKSESLYLDESEQPVSASNLDAEQKFSDFDRTFNNLVGSVGFSYAFNDKLLTKLNVSRGFRAPNIAELGSNGEHEGTFRYEVGNKDLESETSIQFDGGIEFTGNHLNFQMNAFYNAIDQFIYLEKLTSVLGGDSISASDEAQPVFQYTQGKAQLFGGELMLDIHPHPLDWLHFKNSFSISIGQLKNQPDSMKYTPFQPAPKLRSELRADFKNPNKTLGKVYLKVFYEYNFEQNRIFSAFGTETTTPAYGVLGAGIGVDWLKNNNSKLFSFHVAATNLLDKSYQNHLSRLKYAPENPATGKTGLYNMGRNISLKLIVPFDFK